MGLYQCARTQTSVGKKKEKKILFQRPMNFREKSGLAVNE